MEPIIALATPPFKSALALLRLSGDGLFGIVSKFINKEIGTGFKRKMIHGSIVFKNKPIDDVMLFCYEPECSMTGEEVVEITCHGSMVIVKEIVEAFLSSGVRYAERGEFSARAFYFGKMDLIEAESVNDLINASTKEAKDLALLSYLGKVSPLLTPLKNKISELLAKLEVNIDFPEYEDIEETSYEDVISSCNELRSSLSTLIKEGNEGKIIREGVKAAIVGEPNVGKSSILNALLNEDKAIVTSIPGTTRDVIEGYCSFNGVPFILLDTAGIRESNEVVENIGIERSKKSIADSDMVLLISDTRDCSFEKEIEELSKGKILLKIKNKSDLINKKEEGYAYISAINKDIEPLKKAMFDSLNLSEKSFSNPSFSNERELSLLRKIDSELEQIISDCKSRQPIDLICSSLLNAYNYVRELFGEDPTHDLSDEIFSRFCVGK